jgi:uncharacterized protein (UPF0335 family)
MRFLRRFTTEIERVYHKAAEKRLETITDQLEDIGEKLNIEGFDVAYSVIHFAVH